MVATSLDLREIAPRLDLPITSVAIGIRRGESECITECAVRLILGDDVEQDLTAAVRHLKRAGRLGNAAAKCLQGILELDARYELGYAPPARAMKLLNAAANDADKVAQMQLALLIVNCPSLEQRLSLAVDLFRRAADEGSVSSLYQIGVLHYEGRGVPKKPRTALRYFEAAADKGDVDAAFNAGLIHVTGEAGRRDYRAAVRLFLQAAKQNHPRACYELGLLCATRAAARHLLPEADEAALARAEADYYQQSAARGCALGQVSYAVCCMNGDGRRRDPVLGASMYANACLQAEPTGFSGLAKCLASGDGIEFDPEEAVRWFELADEPNRWWVGK